jgi:glycosyltransferase involved in cell wall biosynthesis
VADYAAALEPAIAAHGEPRVDLYHIGNNGLHAGIYRRATEKPGVVLLHDAVLHHFLLGTLDRGQYIEEFVFNYGEWRRELAAELWEGRGNSGVDPRYFEFPMLRRIVQASRVAVAHNPGAARMAREHGAKRVEVIPHFFEESESADGADAARFRERLGISQRTFLFGIFGYLRETKRVLPTLRAFARLRDAGLNVSLLVAGEAVSRDLDRLLETDAVQPDVYRAAYLNDADFRAAARAIDCCVNLRYPGAGETSGVAIRMMGIGKPVIVTASEENSEFPDTACLRVRAGIAEIEELFDHMVMVSAISGMAREIGRNAQRHIGERHSLSRVAGEYWKVLCEAAA